MSTLAKFLDAKQPLFDHSLTQLELRTGKQGVDARLAAEIASKVADRSRQLGISPDCSGPELYDALINHIGIQDEHLARSIGGQDAADVAEMTPLIMAAALKADVPREGFFIKREVAETMLQKMPPTRVMDRLGYTSLAKTLAAESIQEIVLALRFAEEPDWLNQFNELYKDLTPDDFENRPIELIRYQADKWGNIGEHFVQKKLHNITNSKEIGAIAVLPMPMTRMKGITVKDLGLIMHYYNEIRLYSSFFKLMRTKRNFGDIIATTLIADPSHAKLMTGDNIHWRVIQRYFGKLPKEQHPEIFQPHLQPEDLHWRKAEAILYELDPELEFWRDLDYVAALKGDDIVALNPLDVSFSYSNGLAYADRYIYHFRESLWNEIFARYFSQHILEEQLLVKLDNDLIKPEELKP